MCSSLMFDKTRGQATFKRVERAMTWDTPLPTPARFPTNVRYRSYPQRLVALVGHLCRRKWGAGNIPLLARYSPDGQRKDANTLSLPIEHPDILLEVCYVVHAIF